MIVRFLKASASFGGVYYNTDKIAAGQAELMAAVNFGMLNSLAELRPQDYVNHLKAVSALNKGISEPQLHVAISTTGTAHSKEELTAIAKTWMGKMGYADQPYLVAFHSDTEHNHVHIVSTRIDHEGRKIDSGFERVRGIKAMNEIMGLDVRQTVAKDLEKALSYRCSTLSQFKLLLEGQGYTVKDNALIKFGKKLADVDLEKVPLRSPDQHRASQLKAIFKKYAPRHDQAGFAEYLKTKMVIELVFHARDGKPAYGYTVLDHAQKNTYKGSEIMPLKELMLSFSTTILPQQLKPNYTSQQTAQVSQKETTHFNVNIARDVDDDQIHGPRRRRKRKARTNTR